MSEETAALLGRANVGPKQQDARQYVDERRQLWLDPVDIGLEERRRIVRRLEERERWERFAQFVRGRRLAIGRSQTQCAKMAKLTQTKWNRIENAQFTVLIEAIPGIAKSLETESASVYREAGFDASNQKEAAAEDEAEITGEALRTVRQELSDVKGQLNRIEKMLNEMVNPSVNKIEA